MTCRACIIQKHNIYLTCHYTHPLITADFTDKHINENKYMNVLIYLHKCFISYICLPKSGLLLL